MLFSFNMLNPPPEGVVSSDVLVGIQEWKVPYIPIPVTNTTDHTIYLNHHKAVGHPESVKTVDSVAIQTKGNKKTPNMKDSTASNKATSTPQPLNKKEERSTSWDPPCGSPTPPRGTTGSGKDSVKRGI